MHEGISVDYQCLRGNAYLQDARNFLATMFMESKATDLLFVDADIGFHAEAAIKIAKATKPFIAGAYRFKSDVGDFPITPLKDAQVAEDGTLEVEKVPTGFLRLNREVLKAVDRGGYFVGGDINMRREYFRVGMDDRTRFLYGEDIWLCRDWRALGGKIHIIPNLNFGHFGTKGYHGNWAQSEMAKQPAATPSIPADPRIQGANGHATAE